MSNKEALIELIRQQPDDAKMEALLRFFEHRLAETAWSAEELSDQQWRQFIAHSLQNELADPREDIYTEADGEPVDGER